MKKKKTANTKALIGIAANIRAASSKTKLSIEQIKAAKDAGCPAFHPSGRIDCDALIEYAAEHPGEVGIEDGTVNKHLEEALRVRVDRMTREVKLGILKKQLIDKGKARSGVQAAISLLFTELDRLFLAELPGSAKGKDEMGIKREAELKITELRTVLAAKFAAIGEGEDDN